MSSGETVRVEEVGADVSPHESRHERTISALAVGVVVWLSSELMFFSGLFAAYFALRGQTEPWPPVGVELATGRTAVATVVLLGSSVTMHRAVHAARHDDRLASARWLVLTIAMAAVFMVNQGIEYAESTFSISSHAYGSMFFLMTGFHGLHVLGGMVLMGSVIWTITGRTSRAPAAQTVEMCAYYWHFVDAVWVVMFATLYVLR
jgi:cytochrome c oxidase subunit 3